VIIDHIFAFVLLNASVDRFDEYEYGKLEELDKYADDLERRGVNLFRVEIFYESGHLLEV
jgi:hypothetical protein